MISIGLVSGPHCSIFEERVRIFLEVFAENRKGLESVFFFNIVFHSPLSLKKADHEGMITGAFSRKKWGLLVAIAVPENIPSLNDRQVDNYIIEQLHKATDFGLNEAAKKNIHMNPVVYHAFIDEISKLVTEQK
jgi:hypothetical protein